jgi:hypothetical protein
MPPNRLEAPVYFTANRLKFYLWALLVVQIATCFAYRSAIRGGAVDYRLYYTAGYMLRSGNAPLLYNYAAEQRAQSALVSPASNALPFFAPPFTALLFVPLSLLSYLPSLLLFELINLALLSVIILIMSPHLHSLSARWPPVPALLFLTFLPVGLTLAMGQLSILILLFYCAAFVCVQRGCNLIAGLILSLALIKFQIAIPVAFLFLCWRQRRFTAGFLCGAALLLALSAWILGPHALLPYLQSITHMSELTGTELQRTVAISPGAIPNLHGLILSFAHNNRVATILAVIASLALLAWAATRRPSLPLALLVGMLVSYHLYPCDLTLALLPISLLCNRLFSDDDFAVHPPDTWIQQQRPRILLCALGALLIGPLMVEIINFQLIFLYALPLLALALCPADWSTLTLRAARTSLETQPSAV